MSKQSPYDAMRHDLDTEMLSASTLPTKPQQQGFVNRSFLAIHKALEEKQIHHAEYVKLINRLAAFKQGAYNDYLDMLAGAAQMGMLELAIQGEIAQFTPEAARERSQTVSDITGSPPITPEE
jgi:hypothetical protein